MATGDLAELLGSIAAEDMNTSNFLSKQLQHTIVETFVIL